MLSNFFTAYSAINSPNKRNEILQTFDFEQIIKQYTSLKA